MKNIGFIGPAGAGPADAIYDEDDEDNEYGDEDGDEDDDILDS